MFRLVVIAGVAAIVAAALGHLVIFGPKRAVGPKGERTVRRFSLWERFVHAITILGFLALAVTGFVPVFLGSALHGWFWVIHLTAAPVFSIGLIFLVMTWARDGVFASCDLEWAMKFGGYLWGDKHAPAERFNAGQKAYFWVVAVMGLVSLVTGLGRAVPVFDAAGQDVLYQIHRYTALIFVMGGIVHLYLGTLANPGTLGAMMTGKVTPGWAESHHPLWRETEKSEDKKTN
jgi:formate dehydrogenase subunit gamma